MTHPLPVTSVHIGVLFPPDVEPRTGHCPACSAVMDDSGCRVLAVFDAGVHLPFLGLGVEVECHDPDQVARQRAWEVIHGPYQRGPASRGCPYCDKERAAGRWRSWPEPQP